MAFDLSKLTSLIKVQITKPGKKTVVGVDVGSSSIKVVQLVLNKNVPTLETYGELQLGPYESSEIGRTTHIPVVKLVEAFIDILRESSVTAKDVALAISYNGSFTSIIPIPTTDTAQIPAMIPVEARKYIPVPLGEVTIDWFPVSARSDASQTNILLVAIHNEVLKRYDAMVQGASLNSTFSELEMFSSIRSSVAQEDDTVAIIDIGASSTKLYIAEKGVVGKTHSVLMNGVDFTNAVAKNLGIPFKDAEEMKRKVGLLSTGGDPRITKVLTPMLERGLREMHKVMQRYEETDHMKVGKVILSGGGALLRGIPVYAQDLFSRPVVVADSFSKVAYPAFLEDTLKDAGPSFAVAVGAALRALMIP